MRARTSIVVVSVVTVVSTLVLVAGPAGAEYSLREKQFMKQEDGYLAPHVKKANEKCGSSLNASIDWASFQGEVNKRLDGKLHRSPSGYCALVPDNMWSMCRDDADAKAAIQKKVKTYVCKFGGKGKRNISLDGSTLTFWVDWEAPNNDPYIKGYLGKKL